MEEDAFDLCRILSLLGLVLVVLKFDQFHHLTIASGGFPQVSVVATTEISF